MKKHFLPEEIFYHKHQFDNHNQKIVIQSPTHFSYFLLSDQRYSPKIQKKIELKNKKSKSKDITQQKELKKLQNQMIQHNQHFIQQRQQLNIQKLKLQKLLAKATQDIDQLKNELKIANNEIKYWKYYSDNLFDQKNKELKQKNKINYCLKQSLQDKDNIIKNLKSKLQKQESGVTPFSKKINQVKCETLMLDTFQLQKYRPKCQSTKNQQRKQFNFDISFQSVVSIPEQNYDQSETNLILPVNAKQKKTKLKQLLIRQGKNSLDRMTFSIQKSNQNNNKQNNNKNQQQQVVKFKNQKHINSFLLNAGVFSDQNFQLSHQSQQKQNVENYKVKNSVQSKKISECYQLKQRQLIHKKFKKRSYSSIKTRQSGKGVNKSSCEKRKKKRGQKSNQKSKKIMDFSKR